MSQPTPEEILAQQGTRWSEKNPWETYSASFDEKLDPKLEAEIADYASRRHEKSSSQNEEELAKQKEFSAVTAKEYQWVTPEEYADVKQRMGRIMHSSTLINDLRGRCKVKCWYRDHPQPGKVTLLVQKGEGIRPPEVGCWVQLGFMPEYSIMDFDEHGVPLAEKYRGWRTVLLQLIIKGVVTETVAHKVFGEADAPCSGRYNSILYSLRNTLKE